MFFTGEAMLKKRNFHFHFLTLGILLGLAPVSSTLAATLENQLKTCSYCHGKDGASTDSDVPIIGGY
jgi:cytochrome subunit of sulfide dehydrogenase